MRKTYIWTLPRTRIALGKRTIVMGILNVTPDSFSDGGAYFDIHAALARGEEMQLQGADVLDIGGESSRPGSTPVSEEEELRRILPVVEALNARLTIPISIDTYRSRVAQKAVEAGAQIVNDISAFRFDSAMPVVVKKARAGIVLMHSRGSREELHKQPPMRDPTGEVQQELQLSIRLATEAGIERSAIVVDPGIGFGKRAEESVTVLRNLQALSQLEYPLLIGTSRKSFLRKIVSDGPMVEAKDRLWGTAVTIARAILAGAHIVRVHDVAEMRTFVDALDALEAFQATDEATDAMDTL
jgi:dihydropteroate synthase